MLEALLKPKTIELFLFLPQAPPFLCIPKWFFDEPFLTIRVHSNNLQCSFILSQNSISAVTL